MLIEEQIICVVGGRGMAISKPQYSFALLLNLKGHLLCKMGYSGDNPAQWEFRDETGRLLDDTVTLESLSIPAEGKLYLTLKPGVGA